MPSNTVAVFGGTGFLGGAIVRRLAEAGYSVRVAARRPRPPEGMAAGRGVELCTADVRDSASISAALDGASAAINAVSLYVEPRNGPTFDAIHVQGARRLARHAREAGAERLLHVSGVGASSESSSRYIRARGEGEARVREAFPSTTILRPTVLFGRGDAFLSAIDGLTRAPVIPLFGDGSTRLQPVHVEDLASATERMLALPDSAGQVFELGGAEIYTYRDIVARVLAHRGRRRPLMRVPFGTWQALARALSLLPSPPLTNDQVTLMMMDNVADPQAHGFADLGIEPRSLEAALAESLGGRSHSGSDDRSA